MYDSTDKKELNAVLEAMREIYGKKEEPKKDLKESVNTVAFQQEVAAFNALEDLFGYDAMAIITPQGAGAGFPDFAFRTKSKSGKVIDVHFEYKADNKAQMSSMRDWIFDGRKFTTKAIDDADKELMLLAMNSNPEIMSNAKRIYKDFNDVSKEMNLGKVPVLSSGLLSGLSSDFGVRKEFTKAVVNRTEKQQMGSIKGGFGPSMINFYKKKFMKNIKSSANGSILLFMIKDRVWLMDTTGDVNDKEIKDIAKSLGHRDFDRRLNANNIDANLEVRLSIRPGSTPFSKAKMDPQAAMRLRKAPPGGTKLL